MAEIFFNFMWIYLSLLEFMGVYGNLCKLMMFVDDL